MKDYLIQSIDADLTDLVDRLNQLEKLFENFGKKLAKQQEIIDVLIEKIQACPYD